MPCDFIFTQHSSRRWSSLDKTFPVSPLSRYPSGRRGGETPKDKRIIFFPVARAETINIRAIDKESASSAGELPDSLYLPKRRFLASSTFNRPRARMTLLLFLRPRIRNRVVRNALGSRLLHSLRSTAIVPRLAALLNAIPNYNSPLPSDLHRNRVKCLTLARPSRGDDASSAFVPLFVFQRAAPPGVDAANLIRLLIEHGGNGKTGM